MVADWIEPPKRPASKQERLDSENAQLRIALDLVSGALVDAKTIPVPTDVVKYGESVRQLYAERDQLAAENAQLRRELEEAKTEIRDTQSARSLLAEKFDQQELELTRAKRAPSFRNMVDCMNCMEDRHRLKLELVKAKQRIEANEILIKSHHVELAAARRKVEELEASNISWIKRGNEAIEKADAQRQAIEALAEALKDIKSDPHGCVYCDSGKLHNPQKQHQPRCGFAKIDAALATAAHRG